MTDLRLDAYIAKSADFARPILEHFRAVVHAGCPDVSETIKWGHPSFQYRGPLCGMASFKEHCRIAFSKGALIDANVGWEVEGPFGMWPRVTSIKELPSKAVLTRLVKDAARLNEQGAKMPAAARAPRPEAVVPDDLMAALKKNRRALTAFEAFSPSHRREYIEWITGAKRDETRQRRLETAIAQIAEGKPQNWKYMK
jgi:uncharacterized protein YdeI (YjbR/CyaY-like superfamily)